MTINDNDKINFANTIINERKESITKEILSNIPSQLHPAFFIFLGDFNDEIELELVSGAYTVDDEFPILYGIIEDQFWDWASYAFNNPFEWDNYPTP